MKNRARGDDDIMSYGFTPDELEELARQGVEPWDPCARDVLESFNDDDEEDYVSWKPRPKAALSAGDMYETCYDEEGETYVNRTGEMQTHEPAPCETYVAEEIVGHRLRSDGVTEYKVKWQHYDLWDATWETAEALRDQYGADDDLVKSYVPVKTPPTTLSAAPLTKAQKKKAQRQRASERKAAAAAAAPTKDVGKAARAGDPQEDIANVLKEALVLEHATDEGLSVGTREDGLLKALGCCTDPADEGAPEACGAAEDDPDGDFM